MPAPDPSFIVTNPPALNPRTVWPFQIDEFPADTIFGDLGRLAPSGAPKDPAPSQFRTEPQ